jgi:ribose 1,5-bisphosphokinase PhnN
MGKRMASAMVSLLRLTPELRARRLANRGRERAGELAARLACERLPATDAELIIENTGPLDDSGRHPRRLAFGLGVWHAERKSQPMNTGVRRH